MKIKCKYCERRNPAEEDLCLSCGAVLPDLVISPDAPQAYWVDVTGSSYMRDIGLEKKLEFLDLRQYYYRVEV